MEEISNWSEEIIADVRVMFINPYQIDNMIGGLCEVDKLSLDDLFTIKSFCNNNYELQNFKLNKLGNFDNVFTNGKVFCICWISCKEDKELTLLKINAFFRPEYKFLDLASDKLMTRVI
jgi:hypothetical protein